MNKRESIQISKEINYNASPSLPPKKKLLNIKLDIKKV